MPIRRSQKKRDAEPRQKQNQRRLVIDPMVNPGSSAHRHQARSKAHPTRTHHRMVTLAQSSPGDRSAYAPKSKTATVMLGPGPREKTLLRRGLSQRSIGFELRRDPLTQPFRLEHGTMDRVVKTHSEQRLSKLLLQRGIEIGARREHAVIERRRGPNLRQR